MLSEPQVWTLIVSLVALLGGAGIWAARVSWLRDFLHRAEAEAHNVVLEVEQVYVDRILAGRAPESAGGAELTPDEKEIALHLAVARLEELLGLATIERALRILGLPRVPDFVRRWLTTRVEARVKLLSMGQERT